MLPALRAAAEISAQFCASSTATVATTVADVAVTKSGSPPSVTGGANITYTVTVTNNGPSDALTASMSDAVPANTTFVSETQTAGPAFSCSTPPGGGTGTTTCTIGTLVNGASATFSIAVKVNSGAPAGTNSERATEVAWRALDELREDPSAERAPLQRNVDVNEVGSTGVFLASDASSGITGEIIYVDCGYNIMGF